MRTSARKLTPQSEAYAVRASMTSRFSAAICSFERPAIFVRSVSDISNRNVQNARSKSMPVSRTATYVRMSQRHQLLQNGLQLARICKNLRDDIVERVSLGKMPDGHGDPSTWLEYPQPLTKRIHRRREKHHAEAAHHYIEGVAWKG